MNRIRNHSKELIVLTILLAVAVSVVNAAVFVYYPMTINAQWVGLQVYFSEGTNANKNDLNGMIDVSLIDDNTTATITVHPCRKGTTYYKDILRINNNGSQTYYIRFQVTQAFTDTDISKAELIVRDSGGNEVGRVNLRTGSPTPSFPWSLSNTAGNNWFRVDLNFTISSSSAASSPVTAKINLVYSPTTESP